MTVFNQDNSAILPYYLTLKHIKFSSLMCLMSLENLKSQPEIFVTNLHLWASEKVIFHIEW